MATLAKNLYIKTYGCQMNIYDSELITKFVTPLGYKHVESAELADLVVLNTCHIRDKAAEKVYSELGILKKIAEKQNRRIVTVVAGCLAQAEGEEIAKRASNVDIIIGPQSLHTLPELLIKKQLTSEALVNLDFAPIAKFDSLREELERTRRQNDGKTISAFLSIQEGCDKFCTYCVVPYTRGMEYSRSVEEIYNEAVSMVKGEAKEIVLLGQNVNGYHGSDKSGKVFDLSMLIEKISDISGIKRVRYTTSHPNDMHEGLYYAHSANTKLMPFLHLPVQSGSNKILRRMNRKYTVEQYLTIVERLRKIKNDIQFSSDFIVGFAGETEEDFEQTMQLVEKVNYAQAYSFKYSIRPGTPGAEYKDQVEEEIKKERLYRLQHLLRKQQLAFNQSQVSKVVEVLFDRRSATQVIGRTPYMQVVYDDDVLLYGKVVKMLITSASHHTLKGSVTEIVC